MYDKLSDFVGDDVLEVDDLNKVKGKKAGPLFLDEARALKKQSKEVHTPEEIWEAFKNIDEETASTFFQMFGYGIKEIEKIGYEKFIAANGWTNKEDINSWMKDRLHLTICPSCVEDFGILETDSGLCESCKPFFHYDLVGDFDTAISDGQGSIAPIAYFVMYKSFRDLFKSSGNLTKDVEKSDFLKHIVVQRVINDIIITRMNRNQSIEKISAGTLHKLVRDYAIDRVKIVDMPGVKELSRKIFEKHYDLKTNNYNLVKISYDVAREATKFVIATD